MELSVIGENIERALGGFPNALSTTEFIQSFTKANELSNNSATVGLGIGKCSFSYAMTISDMTDNSIAFLSLVGVLSLVFSI